MELVPGSPWVLSMDRVWACDIIQVQSIRISNLPLAWRDGPGDSLAVSEPHGEQWPKRLKSRLSPLITVVL